MENSSSKMEAMKPVLYKSGIPLALSLAGLILARIATRKSCLSTASLQQSQIQEDIQESDSCEEESFRSLDLECPTCADDDHTYGEASHLMDELQPSSHVEENREVEEEILGLKRGIEAMQDREWQLEKQFLYYQDLKNQEMFLMEILNKMMLEINRVEFLGREISSLEEAANQRFEDIAVDYLNLLRLLEFFKSEKGKLHKRVKKLLRRTKDQSKILRKQNRQIQSKETKISRNKRELELKGDCIRLMEDEIKKLKREKKELSYKLRAAEESAGSKVGKEKVSIENYNQVASELERLQKDEATEVKELIHLRWSNACLRHELTRRNEEQEHRVETTQIDNNFGGIEEFGSDMEMNRRNVVQGDSYFGSKTQNRAHSRRRKLITKFKRWMEGGEKTNKQRLDEEKHGKKCFPRHAHVSEVAEEDYLHARNSCSSV